MSACENHADREGLLAVSLPSIGIMRYMCAECRTAFDKKMVDHATTARQSARSGFQPFGGLWESSPDGRSYITDHAYLNPNAAYERNQYNDFNRSKE